MPGETTRSHPHETTSYRAGRRPARPPARRVRWTALKAAGSACAPAAAARRTSTFTTAWPASRSCANAPRDPALRGQGGGARLEEPRCGRGTRGIHHACAARSGVAEGLCSAARCRRRSANGDSKRTPRTAPCRGGRAEMPRGRAEMPRRSSGDAAAVERRCRGGRADLPLLTPAPSERNGSPPVTHG
jgi:hypothetical protein